MLNLGLWLKAYKPVALTFIIRSLQHLKLPTLSQWTMPTAPMKRRLKDMDMPMSKRSKTSYGFQEVINPQSLDTETTSSPTANMIGGNFRNFMRATERKSNKKRKFKKGSSTLTSTRIKNIPQASSKCDLPKVSIPSTRGVTSSQDSSATQTTTISVPSTNRLTSSINSSSKQITTNNTFVYKCKLCWRRYPRKSLVVLHNHAVHHVKIAHKLCDHCGIIFTEHTGHGPWKDCCMTNIRKYIMHRFDL